MHQDFAEKNGPVSFERYRRESKLMSISFTKLGNEQYEVCERQTQHGRAAHGATERGGFVNVDGCDECHLHGEHLLRASQARTEYVHERGRQEIGKMMLFAVPT